MNEDFKLFLGIGCFIVLTIVVVSLVAITVDRFAGCPAFSSTLERLYRHSVLVGGCFVQTKEGRWVLHKDNHWSNPVMKK